MTTRRRILLWATLLLVLTGLGSAGIVVRARQMERKLEQIRPGMSASAAARILKQDFGIAYEGLDDMNWRFSGPVFMLSIETQSGRVTKSSLEWVPDPPLLDRIRYWLGI
jgi:hypothetical protein